jgi:hypothetical protein
VNKSNARKTNELLLISSSNHIKICTTKFGQN